MDNSQNLNNILKRIESGNWNDSDLESLRELLQNNNDNETLQQLGKFNVSIDEAREIHIGDRHYFNWNNEAIQALVEVVQTGKAVAVFNPTGKVTIYNYYNSDREETQTVPVEPTEDTDNLPCPYRELFNFSPEDAEYFFGRNLFIEKIYQATQNKRFIPIIGASGSGKSSVILAGLVPKLVEAGHWQFTHFRPGKEPCHALAKALVPLYAPNLNETELIGQARQLTEYFQDNTVPLSDVFSTIQHNHPQDKILLIADQFEELYTLCTDEQTRHQFLDILLEPFQACAEESSLSTVLVATMRADFLGNALSYRPLVDVLQKNDIKLGPMNETELRDVIEKPAQKLDVHFESGLVERILNDVEKEPGNLPLLEFALTKLWKKRKGKQLTHDAYQEIGKVSGALTRYADDEFSKLKPEEQQQVRRIFVQLVRPGAGTEDTRRVATKAELNETNWSLVKKLADSRLVVTSRTVITHEIVENSQLQPDNIQEQEKEQETVEVVHEALIRNWGQLRGWMETDREFRTWQERLRESRRQWQNMKRDRGLLLRGAALLQAQEQLKQHREELPEAEKEFIQKSQKYKQRQRYYNIGFITASFVAISGVAVVAVLQSNKAKIGEKNAEFRADIATLESRFNTSLDVQLDVIKLNQELHKSKTTTVDIQIRGANLLRQMADWPGQKEVNRLQGHANAVRGVVFSPNGDFIASASWDGTVKLWKADGTLVQTLKGHESGVNAVAFSPKGDVIASASRDNTVKLWKADGTLLHTLQGHESGVNAVAFGSKGDLIASASRDNTVKLWKADGTLLHTLQGHESGVNAVAFSPKGDLIASASFDRTVKLWKADGTLVQTLQSHEDSVWGVAFSPKGDLIASASFDKTVKLWKADGTLVRTLQGHGEWVNGVAFSPKGDLIASASYDGTVKLWKADGTLLLHTLQGNESLVIGVAFGPKGDVIASASRDNTVKLWKADGTLLHTLQGHESGVNAVAFGPKGDVIASASRDNTVKLWKADGTLLHTLQGHESGVNAVAFGPKGDVIASASRDNTVKLWKADGTLLHTLQGHESGVNAVAFGSKGDLIASASRDNTVKLWKADGTLLHTLQGHESGVNAVAFSPKGDLIASASFDRTVKLWKADGTLVQTLQGHGDSVNGVAFSPNGDLIASASDDGTVKLWNFQQDLLLEYACNWVSDYLKNNPNVTEKERRLCGVEASATALFLEGEKLAAEGQIEKAVSKFKQAVNLDPNFSSNSAKSLVRRGKYLATNNRIEKAISAYEKAQKFDSDLEITASDWNTLCWEGSVKNQEKEVMEACEKAVELAPDNGLIYNSRGLARALTGDVESAIKDFKTFVEWTDNEEAKAQRKGWIDSLKKGKNPFTEEVLERLRED